MFTALAYGTVHQPIIALVLSVNALLIVFWAIDAFSSGALRFNKSLLQLPLIATDCLRIFSNNSIRKFSRNRRRLQAFRARFRLTRSGQMFPRFIFSQSCFLCCCSPLLTARNVCGKWSWLITIFGFVFAFFAILQVVLESDENLRDLRSTAKCRHPFGSFVNRHNFAAYMEMTIAVPLGLMFAGAVPKDKRLFLLRQSV